MEKEITKGEVKPNHKSKTILTKTSLRPMGVSVGLWFALPCSKQKGAIARWISRCPNV